jgi:hypothetical protein
MPQPSGWAAAGARRVAALALFSALAIPLAAVCVRAQPALVTTTLGASPTFVQQAGCDTWNTPFCNALMPPPPGWTGHVFKLSQAYPQSAHPYPRPPWAGIDPKRDPNRYAYAVLGYFYEGNIHGGGTIENDFDPALNHVRRWYNAPFQDLGLFGREFVHGLTEERNSAPHELPPRPTSGWANYAVGYYNAPGATVIAHVWNPWRAKAGSQPDIVAARTVPEGTVAAKLLFTTASTGPGGEVPFIADAPAWNAWIYKNVHAYPSQGASNPRVIGKVRLLQIDFAVKDHNAGPTGWFFGTFVYGGGPGYTGPKIGTGWRNVAPVGLMWGNDPGYTPPPSPQPSTLKETWLNPNVHMLHYGYQNRLNGPVDNPVSACMSCHATGEINAQNRSDTGSGMIAPIPMPTPPATPPPHDIAYWFRNIGPSEPFDKPGYVSTGYSLQVMDGIRNYYTYIGATSAPNAQLRAARVLHAVQHDDRPPRDGGPTH